MESLGARITTFSTISRRCTHTVPLVQFFNKHFVHLSTSPQNKERDSTALIAYLSMKVLVADVHLLVRNGFAADSTQVDEAFKDALE